MNQTSAPSVSFFLHTKDFFLALTLFGLNFFFIWPFLGRDFPEIDFSAPVLPFLANMLDLLTPFNFSQAVGVLVLFSFPLASFAWYFFFKRLSSSSVLSFLAGLIFLLPWFYLPRFALFWQKGDAVHALGFAVLPLVGMILLQFLKTGSFNRFLASFLGVSVISLISPFTLLNLYLFFLVLTFSEMLLGQARIKILRFFFVCLFAQGFSSFWYHPYFLLSLLKSNQGQAALSSLWKLFPVSFFVVPVFSAFSFLLFDRKPHLQSLFFAMTITILYLALVAADTFGVYLPFPVPDRFLPEFYIGLSFFLAIAIKFLMKLPKEGLNLGKIYPRLAFVHHSSEVFLTALITAFILWPVFSIFSGISIIPTFETPQVLGAQSLLATHSGGEPWWQVSRGGFSQILGYGISFLTAIGGAFLRKRIQ